MANKPKPIGISNNIPWPSTPARIVIANKTNVQRIMDKTLPILSSIQNNYKSFCQVRG